MVWVNTTEDPKKHVSTILIKGGQSHSISFFWVDTLYRGQLPVQCLGDGV